MMAVLEARDNEGQVIYGASMDQLGERTRNAGTEYTSWSVFEVAHTAAGTEPQKTYLGYMIDRQFVSLDEIDAERHADEPGRPGRDPEDHYADNQGRPYDRPGWYVSEYERDHEPDLDELLGDPEVAAEADRILAGEGGTILGIPFAPKRDTERGE